MALTRKLLKGMGLTEEQIDSVIDAHTETVDGLKAQVKSLQEAADKLPVVQKELDDIKNGEDWKAKYEAEAQAFKDFRAEISGKETLDKIKSAYRKLLEAQGIDKDDIDLIMSATKYDSMKLDGDNLADSDKLTEGIKERYARYIPTEKTKGAKPETPPANNGSAFDTMSLTDKMAYANKNPDSAEVQAWLRK